MRYRDKSLHELNADPFNLERCEGETTRSAVKNICACYEVTMMAAAPDAALEQKCIEQRNEPAGQRTAIRHPAFGKARHCRQYRRDGISPGFIQRPSLFSGLSARVPKDTSRCCVCCEGGNRGKRLLPGGRGEDVQVAPRCAAAAAASEAVQPSAYRRRRFRGANPAMLSGLFLWRSGATLHSTVVDRHAATGHAKEVTRRLSG